MRRLFLLMVLAVNTSLVLCQEIQFLDALNKTPLSRKIIIVNLDSVVTDWDGKVEIKKDSLLIVATSGYEHLTISPAYFTEKVLLMPKGILMHQASVSAGESGKLIEVASSVGQLSKEQLASAAPFSVNTYFNNIPGITAHNGALNTNRIMIRGIGSRTPFSTNRLRAFYEDIPLTDGEGTSIIEDIDLSQIGKIEALKGTSSSIYGSGLGGSIKVYAPHVQKEGLSGDLTIDFGSYATLKNTIALNYKKKNQQIVTRLSKLSSAGYRNNNDYNRLNGLVMFKSYLKNWDISLLINYISLEAQIPSSLDLTSFLETPSAAADNWLQVRGFEKYRRLLSAISINHRLGSSWEIKSSLYNTFFDQYESRPFNILDDKSIAMGSRNNVSYKTKKLHGQLGFEVFEERYGQRTYETNNGVQGDQLQNQAQKRSFSNIFLFVLWKPTNKISLETTLNRHVLKYQLDNLSLSNAPDETYTYEPILSPRLGISYSLAANSQLYGSLGHGHSAPSVEETLFPSGQINANIEPEQGYTLDLGYRSSYHDGRLELNFSTYFIWLSNLLVTDRISEEMSIGINAGKTRQQGIEVLLSYSVLPYWHNHKLSLSFNTTMSRNRFLEFVDNDNDFSGKSLPGIPVYTTNFNVNWEYKLKFGTNVQYQQTGSQYITDNNLIEENGYHLLSVKSWFKGKLKGDTFYTVNAGINNLLNEKYASMLLINARSFGGRNPRYYYPGQPRNYFIGVTFSF